MLRVESGDWTFASVRMRLGSVSRCCTKQDIVEVDRRMRIFAYEFLTGGGRYSLQSDEELSFHLMAEGRAMIQAICQDLARIPRVQVHALWDHHFPDQQRPSAQCTVVKSADDVLKAFDRQVLNCAYTLIIAPEFGHSLLTFARRAWSWAVSC